MMNFGHDGFRNRCARGIGFETAATAAWTQATTRVDGHMTNFASSSGQSSIHAPVLHNATADARTNKDAHKRVIALARPIQKLAQRRHFHIISDRYRFPELPV